MTATDLDESLLFVFKHDMYPFVSFSQQPDELSPIIISVFTYAITGIRESSPSCQDLDLGNGVPSYIL